MPNLPTVPHPLPAGPDRRRNLRLALILATIAACFFVGFILKMVMLSHR
jgi:hypothetical protein